VNPYPPLYKKQPNGALRYFSWIVGPFLALARITLFVALLLLSVLLGVVLTLLSPIPVLGRLLRRLLEGLLARIMLLTLGVCWIETKDKKAGRGAGGRGATVDAGDIVLCNWTSYGDILYLTWAYSPLFLIPPPQQDSTTGSFVVASKGFVGALLHSMGHQEISADSCEPIATALARAKGRGQPAVVFAEGVRTNGLCVLQMQPFIVGIPQFAGKTHLIALKHTQHLGSLPFTAGSTLKHMFHVCRQLYCSMKVVYMNPGFVGPVPEATKEAPAWVKACRDTIASNGVMKAIAKTAEDKAEFMVFFNTGVKSRKSRVGQGGRAIESETGRAAPQKVDAAILREQRLAAKKEALLKQEQDEDAEDSD